MTNKITIASSFFISVILTLILLQFLTPTNLPIHLVNHTDIQASEPHNKDITPTITPTIVAKPFNTHPLPTMNTRAFIVLDNHSKTVLAAKNPEMALPPASTTKLMTALIALENYQLNDIVTIPDIPIVGSNIDLIPGEQLTVHNLIYAILLNSANEAATALAHHHPNGYTEFIKLMNQKAARLGMNQTSFINPTGLHDPLHLSSVSDLAILSEVATNNSTIEQIVKTKTYTIRDVNGNKVHHLQNLNQLLGTIEGVIGVKTGYTEEAGESLVTKIERDKQSITIVILGSDNRFGYTKQLINWAYESTTWPNKT